MFSLQIHARTECRMNESFVYCTRVECSIYIAACTFSKCVCEEDEILILCNEPLLYNIQNICRSQTVLKRRVQK